MISLPSKIISGGQTGADRAGLDFAIAAGISHGGWCPRGRRSQDGVVPTHYNLQETETSGYEQRTKFNIRDADATIIFNLTPAMSPGSGLTVSQCRSQEKPFLLIRPPMGGDFSRRSAEAVAQFLVEHQPATLNIAGNREESVRGIHQLVVNVLKQAWELVPLIASSEHASKTAKEQQMGLGLRGFGVR